MNCEIAGRPSEELGGRRPPLQSPDQMVPLPIQPNEKPSKKLTLMRPFGIQWRHESKNFDIYSRRRLHVGKHRIRANAHNRGQCVRVR